MRFWYTFYQDRHAAYNSEMLLCNVCKVIGEECWK